MSQAHSRSGWKVPFLTGCHLLWFSLRSLPHGPLHRAAHDAAAGFIKAIRGARESGHITEITVLGTLISEVTSHHFCLLCSQEASHWVEPTLQARSHRCEPQGTVLTGRHARNCLPHLGWGLPVGKGWERGLCPFLTAPSPAPEKCLHDTCPVSQTGAPGGGGWGEGPPLPLSFSGPPDKAGQPRRLSPTQRGCIAVFRSDLPLWRKADSVQKEMCENWICWQGQGFILAVTCLETECLSE